MGPHRRQGLREFGREVRCAVWCVTVPLKLTCCLAQKTAVLRSKSSGLKNFARQISKTDATRCLAPSQDVAKVALEIGNTHAMISRCRWVSGGGRRGGHDPGGEGCHRRRMTGDTGR
jgi:hypothetical protein